MLGLPADGARDQIPGARVLAQRQKVEVRPATGAGRYSSLTPPLERQTAYRATSSSSAILRTAASGVNSARLSERSNLSCSG